MAFKCDANLVISDKINVKKDVISSDNLRKLQISLSLKYLVARKKSRIRNIYSTIQGRGCPTSESQ